MRPIARLLVVATLVPVLAGIVSSGAQADDAAGAGGTAKGYVDEAGNPTAEAVTATSKPPSSAGPPAKCVWELLNKNDEENVMYDLNGKRISSPTGRWYQKVCDGSPVQINGSFAIPEQARVDPAVLAQQARRSVTIADPQMATSPQADRRLYTRVPTWLWVDPGWWRTYSATARAGIVSSTVVARPVRASWTMGDGGQAVCNGPGTQWRRGLSENQSTCSYTYRNASAGQGSGKFIMTVEIEFEVSWTSSLGRGGGLARITRSASKAVEVGEIQAVETQ